MERKRNVEIRQKWIDNVREDLELCNEDLTTATVLAEIEADGEGLSKPHRQHKLMEEKRRITWKCCEIECKLVLIGFNS